MHRGAGGSGTWSMYSRSLEPGSACISWIRFSPPLVTNALRASMFLGSTLANCPTPPRPITPTHARPHRRALAAHEQRAPLCSPRVAQAAHLVLRLCGSSRTRQDTSRRPCSTPRPPCRPSGHARRQRAPRLALCLVGSRCRTAAAAQDQPATPSLHQRRRPRAKNGGMAGV